MFIHSRFEYRILFAIMRTLLTYTNISDYTITFSLILGFSKIRSCWSVAVFARATKNHSKLKDNLHGHSCWFNSSCEYMIFIQSFIHSFIHVVQPHEVGSHIVGSHVVESDEMEMEYLLDQQEIQKQQQQQQQQNNSTTETQQHNNSTTQKHRNSGT